jgi:hypothetical protein
VTYPNAVEIPDARTEGVRSYREADEPHPIQLTLLTAESEFAWVEALREMIVANRLADADAMVMTALAPFEGRVAVAARAATAADVVLEGWEDLLPILAEHEGPAITAIVAGLTNEPDLVFKGDATHDPTLVLALYSDDHFLFSTAPRDQLLGECLKEAPAFAGNDEDVEFYAVLKGLAPLNTLLIQSKHRFFLRDGRDGVEGRAPGGYCEYVLGTWVRALRFLQALDRVVEAHGLPHGARLIAGTSALHTNFACLLRESERHAVADEAEDSGASIAMLATLAAPRSSPRHDPLADLHAIAEEGSGASLRKRLAGGGDVAGAPSPAPLPPTSAARKGWRAFVARLLGR